MNDHQEALGLPAVESARSGARLGDLLESFIGSYNGRERLYVSRESANELVYNFIESNHRYDTDIDVAGAIVEMATAAERLDAGQDPDGVMPAYILCVELLNHTALHPGAQLNVEERRTMIREALVCLQKLTSPERQEQLLLSFNSALTSDFDKRLTAGRDASGACDADDRKVLSDVATALVGSGVISPAEGEAYGIGISYEPQGYQEWPDLPEGVGEILDCLDEVSSPAGAESESVPLERAEYVRNLLFALYQEYLNTQPIETDTLLDLNIGPAQTMTGERYQYLNHVALAMLPLIVGADSKLHRDERSIVLEAINHLQHVCQPSDEAYSAYSQEFKKALVNALEKEIDALAARWDVAGESEPDGRVAGVPIQSFRCSRGRISIRRAIDALQDARVINEEFAGQFRDVVADLPWDKNQ